MKTIPTKTTYLQMLSPDDLAAHTGIQDAAIEPVSSLSVEFYRRLYNTVGGKHYWVDRNRMADAALARIILHPLVDLQVLRVDGELAGYAELDRRVAGEVELAYFGLFPQFIGRGLGKFFLCRSVERAWSFGPRRVWLHTCDLDHPAALPNYLKAGFSIYDEEIIEQPIDES